MEAGALPPSPHQRKGWQLPFSPTDGADDAGVSGNGGLRVDVQAAHVLQEGVSHGSVQLLGLDESGPCIVVLRHGCWNGHWNPVSRREESGAGFRNTPDSLIGRRHQHTHVMNMEVTSCYWVKLSLCSYLRVSETGKTHFYFHVIPHGRHPKLTCLLCRGSLHSFSSLPVFPWSYTTQQNSST